MHSGSWSSRRRPGALGAAAPGTVGAPESSVRETGAVKARDAASGKLCGREGSGRGSGRGGAGGTRGGGPGAGGARSRGRDGGFGRRREGRDMGPRG